MANWKIKFDEHCLQASSKLEEYGDVAQMVEHSLCKREVRESMCRISKTLPRLRQFYFVFADNGKKLTTPYKSKDDIPWNYFSLLTVVNWKIKFDEHCLQASSKLEEYGDVAQMVEHSLCKREVRESMCRNSKTLPRLRQFCFVFADNGKKLTTPYKSKDDIPWNYFSLLTVVNWKIKFDEHCLQASSKLEEYGDVAQMVEHSLCKREVRESMCRNSKTLPRLRQFCFVFADNGKKLTTPYKSKDDIPWNLFKT